MRMILWGGNYSFWMFLDDIYFFFTYAVRVWRLYPILCDSRIVFGYFRSADILLYNTMVLFWVAPRDLRIHRIAVAQYRAPFARHLFHYAKLRRSVQLFLCRLCSGSSVNYFCMKRFVSQECWYFYNYKTYNDEAWFCAIALYVACSVLMAALAVS
jgi:hypothetical protein